MKRIAEIDVARCAMNYMIVLMHAGACYKYVETNTMEWYIVRTFGSFVMNLAMPAFYILSGYLLFKGLTAGTFGVKIMNRIRRLLIPFLAWNALFVVVYLAAAPFVPHIALRVEMFELTTLSGVLSKFFNFTMTPIDGPLWFIRDIFVYSLFALPMLWIMRRGNWRLIIAVMFVWCVIDGYMDACRWTGSLLDSWHLTSYVIGALIAVHGKDLIHFFKPRVYLFVGMIALALFTIWKLPYAVDWGHQYPAWQLVMFKFTTVLYGPVLLCVVSWIPSGRISEWPLFKWLNKMAFFAYAGHFLFCSVLLHSFAAKFPGITHGSGGVTILYLVFFVGGVVLMSGVYWLGLRLMPRVTKLFDGTL